MKEFFFLLFKNYSFYIRLYGKKAVNLQLIQR